MGCGSSTPTRLQDTPKERKQSNNGNAPPFKLKNGLSTRNVQQVLMQSPHKYQIGAGAFNIYTSRNNNKTKGELIYRIVGEKISMHCTKTIYDDDNKPLIIIKTKIGNRQFKTQGYTAAGTEQGEVSQTNTDPLFTAVYRKGETHFTLPTAGGELVFKFSAFKSVLPVYWRAEDASPTEQIQVGTITHDEIAGKDWWIDCDAGIDPLVVACLNSVAQSMETQRSAQNNGRNRNRVRIG